MNSKSLLMACLLFVAGTAWASNPFVAPASESDDRVQVVAENVEQRPSSIGFLRQISDRLLPLQRELHAKISRAIREYKESGTDPYKVLTLLLGAFLYGMVHAVGPGHGKSVACAYFLSRGGRLRHGVFMGMTTALVHTASAVATVMLLRLVMEGAVGVGFEGAVDRMTQLSFMAIAAIGLVMVGLSVRNMLRKSNRHDVGNMELSDKHYFKVAVVSGIIPCPGAAIILFFTLALKVPILGMVLVAAMSLGMGLTVSAAGVLTLCCRTSLLSASSPRSKFRRFMGHAFSLTGALLVTLVGLFFSWASFYS